MVTTQTADVSDPLEPRTPGASDRLDTRGATGRSAADRWRPLLLRWHFYAGILIGPFLLVAAVTGTLYALIPQIDRAVYAHELTVDRIGGAELPLSAQVDAARRAHPEGAIVSVTPAPRAGDTTRVVLATDDLPADRTRTVFVDPYTGEVRGALPTFGEWLPVRAWFDDLHRNLHLGDLGRNYSEIGASWLWVVALGGLILWIGHRRRTHKLARLAVPDRTAPRRARTLSWHGAVGVWIIIGLIGLSASGLSWSRFAGENIGDLRSELSWTTPAVTTTIAGSGDAAAHHGSGAAQTGLAPLGATDFSATDFSKVYDTARAAGLVGPMNISVPAEPGAAWSVKENARGFPSHYDSIAVDPHTFAVTDRVDFARWPFMAKMTTWAISAHMGLFGIVNQIALVALGIGLISVIVRGYLMWWRRRPTTSNRHLPQAPRRGALSGLRPVEALAVVAIAAGLGWFMPWFGIPLALFVIVDAGRGVFTARRRTDTKADAAVVGAVR
ncbi:PepSY domain-containing protein [Gordonia sp. i37]|uniref:PepSY-associated TM helix domain-containing protein n=1 Tax=Gordonia sp. i37 TaxID=1961707 RepID=UPI0009AE68AF|nr:PepSY domain-containing protein [Gordonia sp. i37]